MFDVIHCPKCKTTFDTSLGEHCECQHNKPRTLHQVIRDLLPPRYIGDFSLLKQRRRLGGYDV